MNEQTAAEYEYYQASEDALQQSAEAYHPEQWRTLHYANHYAHAAWKAMKEEAA